MTKFVVAIFPDETKAYQGVRAFRELDTEGDLSLYGIAVVAKDQEGKLAVKQATNEGPLGMAVGAVVGGLIGLLGGPIGVVIGLGGGALLGSLRDLSNLGISGEFLDSVSLQLTPGRVAIVAEVSEDWVTPLDSRMAALDGTIIRRWRSSVEDEEVREDVAALKVELAELKAEYEHAKTEDKAKLKGRIAEVQAKAKAASGHLQARMHQVEQEAEEKLKVLVAQASKSKDETKARIDERITRLRASLDRRSGKLNKAWTLAKEAFAA